MLGFSIFHLVMVIIFFFINPLDGLIMDLFSVDVLKISEKFFFSFWYYLDFFCSVIWEEGFSEYEQVRAEAELKTGSRNNEKYFKQKK